MRKPTSSNDEKKLAEILKREAQETRPAFSESLHQRICDGIESEEPLTERFAPPAHWRRLAPVLAVAATVVISASAVVWWLSRPSAVLPELAEAPVETETVDEAPDFAVMANATDDTVEQLSLLVETTLTDPQWAYLDHDLQLAVRLLMEQFPSMEMLE